MTAVVWFRNDLRIQDHPALFEALANFDQVIPLYIYDEDPNWPLGRASKWWLQCSLESLSNDLKELGLKLIIREGKSAQILNKFETIYYNRHYEPWQRKIEEQIKQPTRSFMGSFLAEPTEFFTSTDRPYQVFTPLYKRYQEMAFEPLCGKPKRGAKTPNVKSIAIKKVKGDYPWEPGEKGAWKRLRAFKKQAVSYKARRDFLANDGVSRLSPYLHFGEISPRQIWQELKGEEPFLRQLVWREFGTYLLYHFPKSDRKPLYEKWEKFPWRSNKRAFERWCDGMTGYPAVDAGMRQLKETGWMHNRARMIVASFLTKDLLIPWQDGAKWFFETLVDADLGNNTLGWQWTAGCGADAAPFFRIFNPITQGEKFDPDGEYIRTWVPELKDVPTKEIHQPWDLDVDYPKPIVNHADAREKALQYYQEYK